MGQLGVLHPTPQTREINRRSIRNFIEKSDLEMHAVQAPKHTSAKNQRISWLAADWLMVGRLFYAPPCVG